MLSLQVRNAGDLVMLDTWDEAVTFGQEHPVVFISHQWLAFKTPEYGTGSERFLWAVNDAALGTTVLWPGATAVGMYASSSCALNDNVHSASRDRFIGVPHRNANGHALREPPAHPQQLR